jgi:hypothetical protein
MRRLRKPARGFANGGMVAPPSDTDSVPMLVSYGAHFCDVCGEWLSGSAGDLSGWGTLRDHIDTEHPQETL